MQGKELYSQTKKKVCVAPTIKSSRPNKSALKNLNKTFSDSPSAEDSADEANICEIIMETLPSVTKRSDCPVVNLAWAVERGTCARFVVYGLTVFGLGGMTQKDVPAICD
jgi:hypothetical protein